VTSVARVRWGGALHTGRVAAAAAAIAVILFLMGTLPTALFFRLHSVTENQIEDENALLVTLERINTLMVDQETGKRGYVITGDSSFLEPYNQGEVELAGLWPAAERQADAIGGEAPAMLAAVKEAARAWQSEAATPELALARAGRQAEARDTISAGAGRNLFDKFRAASAELTTEVEAEREELERDRVQLLRVMNGALIGLALLGLASLALLYLMATTARGSFLQAVRSDAARAESDHARAEVESALQVRDDFLATVSHDLKTPLTGIRGLAQVLRRQFEAGRQLKPDEFIASLRKIEHSSLDMTAMIDELLDLARLQSGQPLDLRLKHADLTALTLGVVGDIRRTAPRHNIQFTSGIDRATGMFDSRRITRVLANALSNAVQYSPPGTDVTVSLEERRPGQADIAIVDEGLGVPASDMPRLFERFYRGSNVRGRFDGLGIGLWCSRQIVEQHGGVITLDSREGFGTTVIISLPMTHKR
jgi:signal transduction histidine kinase